MPAERILVIEDDAVAGLVYRQSLERAGYEVHMATDGQAGLDQFVELAPHGVILDIMLPKRNGIDLLKILRGLPKGKKIPILAVTNAYFPQLVEQAIAAGATTVLSKDDLTPETLPNTLRAATG